MENWKKLLACLLVGLMALTVFTACDASVGAPMGPKRSTAESAKALCDRFKVSYSEELSDKAYTIASWVAGTEQSCKPSEGKTELYRLGEHATTHITSSLQKDRLNVHIYKTTGHFQGQEKNQTTELRINLSQMPKKLAAKIGGKSVKLTQVNSLDELRKTENAWFFDEAPQLNRFATPGSDFEKMDIRKNPMV
jgi:hypothetical protein